MATTKSLSIVNESKNLSKVREAVSEILDATPFTRDMRNKIIVAVDEALANVVEHAYGGDKGTVDIAFELTKEHLRVQIHHADARDDRVAVSCYHSYACVSAEQVGRDPLDLLRPFLVGCPRRATPGPGDTRDLRALRHQHLADPGADEAGAAEHGHFDRLNTASRCEEQR